jgi:hypothetical protein
MTLLEHLNLYFGYDAKSMNEFITYFKDDYEDDNSSAVASLLVFLNMYSSYQHLT